MKGGDHLRDSSKDFNTCQNDNDEIIVAKG